MGCIGDWITSKNYNCTTTRFCDDDELPRPEQIDWLIVMGGPMGVYETDKYVWLNKEIEFIEKVISQQKAVLGVCLGAQLIARALGARVYPNHEKEIGWFPIKLTEDGKQSVLFDGFPEEFSVLHWHGDTFELPQEAVRLAESEACQNQAFVYADRVVGLQFHLEFTRHGVKDLLRECGQCLPHSKYVQNAQSILAPEASFAENNKKMCVLLSRQEHTVRQKVCIKD
jgi:GMP synthase (glutamine-hydrolysing)